jgi:hypothetical protein
LEADHKSVGANWSSSRPSRTSRNVGYGMSALGVQRTYPGFRLKSEFDPSATCRIFHFSSPALITEVLAFADSAVYVYRKIVRPRVAAL